MCIRDRLITAGRLHPAASAMKAHKRTVFLKPFMAVGISFCFFILAVFVRSLTECSYYTMSTKLVEDLAKWPGMTRTKLVRDLAKCSYYTT